ncbi:MAG: sensor histidine kinase [Breznakibacter sp.]
MPIFASLAFNNLVRKYYSSTVHTTVWLAFFVVAVGFFSSAKGHWVAVERAAFMTAIFMGVFYVTWWAIIPKLYVPKKYFWFAWAGIGVVIVSSVARVAVEEYFEIWPQWPSAPVVANQRPRMFLFSLGITAFVFMVACLLRIANFYNKQSREREYLLQQKTEAELRFLKAQLNPHFLFNSLNNIYALVLTRSSEAPDALMSLSQLLRYIIYDAAADKVELEKEITHLRFYVGLESLRLVDRKKLSLDIDALPNGLMVAPMLFIPFVENCFKHGDINKGGYIDIRMTVRGNVVDFYCENSFDTRTNRGSEYGGIGEENSKRRLEALYPRKHSLVFAPHDNIYVVHLTVEL